MNLSAEAVAGLCVYLTQLREILRTEGAFPTMAVLDLSNNPEVTDAVVSSCVTRLVTVWVKVEVVNLSWTSISGTGFLMLAPWASQGQVCELYFEGLRDGLTFPALLGFLTHIKRGGKYPAARPGGQVNVPVPLWIRVDRNGIQGAEAIEGHFARGFRVAALADPITDAPRSPGTMAVRLPFVCDQF
mmetsp:Transcript_95952/g.219972  ORF Transcript_95952/g.219972 Transcript_95952/m.219972 type:complete len:187 (-) Transcript_95952:140-700(-)